LSQVQAQIESLNREAEHAGERYNDAAVRLTEVNRRLKKVRSRLARQQAQVGQMQSVIGQLAAAAYKSGGVDIGLQLLLSKDPQAFLQQASALDQLSKQQRIALREMTRVRQNLAHGRAAVAQERSRAAALQRSLAKEKRTVGRMLAEAKRLFAQLKAQDRARLAALRRQAASRARASRGQYVRASRDTRYVGDESPEAGSSAPSYNGPASGRAAVALRTAFAQLGDPYRWGGTGPNSFDCSGFTSFAWRSAGVSLPHSSAAQYAAGRKISRSELMPGDLVFFYRPISHVAIYIGGNRVIDAPYPGKSVHVTPIDTMPYAGAVRP
jgi:cell wall-associated NlpC family hydrolase